MAQQLWSDIIVTTTNENITIRFQDRHWMLGIESSSGATIVGAISANNGQQTAPEIVSYFQSYAGRPFYDALNDWVDRFTLYLNSQIESGFIPLYIRDTRGRFHSAYNGRLTIPSPPPENLQRLELAVRPRSVHTSMPTDYYAYISSNNNVAILECDSRGDIIAEHIFNDIPNDNIAYYYIIPPTTLVAENGIIPIYRSREQNRIVQSRLYILRDDNLSIDEYVNIETIYIVDNTPYIEISGRFFNCLTGQENTSIHPDGTNSNTLLYLPRLYLDVLLYITPRRITLYGHRRDDHNNTQTYTIDANAPDEPEIIKILYGDGTHPLHNEIQRRVFPGESLEELTSGRLRSEPNTGETSVPAVESIPLLQPTPRDVVTPSIPGPNIIEIPMERRIPNAGSLTVVPDSRGINRPTVPPQFLNRQLSLTGSAGIRGGNQPTTQPSQISSPRRPSFTGRTVVEDPIVRQSYERLVANLYGLHVTDPEILNSFTRSTLENINQEMQREVLFGLIFPLSFNRLPDHQ